MSQISILRSCSQCFKLVQFAQTSEIRQRWQIVTRSKSSLQRLLFPQILINIIINQIELTISLYKVNLIIPYLVFIRKNSISLIAKKSAQHIIIIISVSSIFTFNLCFSQNSAWNTQQKSELLKSGQIEQSVSKIHNSKNIKLKILKYERMKLDSPRNATNKNHVNQSFVGRVMIFKIGWINQKNLNRDTWIRNFFYTIGHEQIYGP